MVAQAVIYSPPDYPHIQAFSEVAHGFHCAFRALNINSDKSLLFGAHLAQRVPDNFIIYQAEQICLNAACMTPSYLATLRTHEVWDYSPKNIATLAENGIEAKYVPVGYMPEMSFIEPAKNKDIDVLHYGSLNTRRQKILQEIQASGANVVHRFGCYGAERDALIARAKIVINIHYHDTCIFEIFRVSHLLANKVCVVSELGDDGELEAPYRENIAMCKYENLVERCLELLAKPQNVRDEIAENGFNIFSKNTQTDILREALHDHATIGKVLVPSP